MEFSPLYQNYIPTVIFENQGLESGSSYRRQMVHPRRQKTARRTICKAWNSPAYILSLICKSDTVCYFRTNIFKYIHFLSYMCDLKCKKQVSRIYLGNYITQNSADVFTCPCFGHLSSILEWLQGRLLIDYKICESIVSHLAIFSTSNLLPDCYHGVE